MFSIHSSKAPMFRLKKTIPIGVSRQYPYGSPLSTDHIHSRASLAIMNWIRAIAEKRGVITGPFRRQYEIHATLMDDDLEAYKEFRLRQQWQTAAEIFEDEKVVLDMHKQVSRIVSYRR